MRTIATSLGLLVSLVFIASSAGADTPVKERLASLSAEYWHEATIIDVAEAYRLLQDNHPGSVAEVQDQAFVDTLRVAHEEAVRRAARVRSFEGYSATLAAFANSFADAHLRSRPVLRVAMPQWASLVIGSDGDRWTVADEVPVYGQSLKGATLIACDGIPVNDLARASLGTYRIDWQVKAQRAQAAPWVLIDEGNPFLKRPASCTFDIAGKRQVVALQWGKIALPALLAKLDANKSYGSAGFGVRPLGKGYLVAVQSFSEGAQNVVRQVQALAPTLRQAPFVILDVRGNGGGSSSFGEDIAVAVLGKDRVASVSNTADCDTVYRATSDNIADFQATRARNAVQNGPEWIKIVDGLIGQMTRAKAEGRALTGPLTCPATATAKEVEAEPKAVEDRFSGKLFIITDNRCFSACLAVVELWRSLGAVQLGRDTSANTTYVDVQEPLMPSGQSTFSTLMGLSPGAPGDSRRLGPFVPQHLFNGDITDTAAVERWALSIASH